MANFSGVKSWFQSKTIRANGIVIVACAFIAASKIFNVDLGTGAEGVDTTAVYVGGIGSLINVVLRFLTVQPIK